MHALHWSLRTLTWTAVWIATLLWMVQPDVRTLDPVLAGVAVAGMFGIVALMEIVLAVDDAEQEE